MGYVNAQLEKFGMHSGRSPGGIGKAHFSDEFSDLPPSIRSAQMTALPSPIETKALTMPMNDCFGLDDQQG